MRRIVILITAVLLLSSVAGVRVRGDEGIRLVACRDGACVADLDEMSQSEFVWIWSNDSPPTRFSMGEAKAHVASGTLDRADSLTITVRRPRDSGPKSTGVIAAPEAMWLEVPEPMLPRFTIPKEGSVTIGHRRGTPWIIRVAGEGEGSWWTRIPSGRGEVAVVPVPATSRDIEIVGASGAPLPGAAVSILIGASASKRALAAQLRAGSDGVVRLESLPDRDHLTLIISEANHAPVTIEDRVSQLPGEIVLFTGAEVGGRFVDGDGEPVSEARVRAEGWLGESGAVVSRQSHTLENGAWQIAQLPPETKLVIVAEKKGFVSFRGEVNVDAESVDLGTVMLEEGESIVVRTVDDAGGGPINGARIQSAAGRKEVSDSKGIATLHDVSLSSEIELNLTADGYLPRTLRVLLPSGNEIEVELTKAFTVKGRFVERDHRPIGGATARVVAGSSFRDVALDGEEFAIPLHPEQPALLELRSPSTRVVRFEVVGKRGEVMDLGVIHPEDGIVVSGRVTTAGGQPVPAAVIWTPRPGASGPLVTWARGDLLRAESDEDGRFALRGAGPEPLLLRIDAPGFARTFRSVSAQEAAMVIDLGEIPLSKGTTVTVVGRGEGAVARLALRRESSDIDTLTGAVRDGVATIRHVPAGPSVLTLHRGRSVVCEKRIDVPEETPELEVDCLADLLHVRGTVMIGGRPAEGGTLIWSSPNAVPVAGIILNRRSSLGAEQQQAHGLSSETTLPVSSSGTFESDELRAGEWSVRWVSPHGGSTEQRDVVLVDQAESTILIHYPGETIAGIVVDHDSLPVSRAVVREIIGGHSAITRTDGTFAVAGLSPGTFRLQAEYRDSRSDVVEVELDPRRRIDPVRLMLAHRTADVLLIRLLTSDGRPAANGFVFVETNQGEMRILTTDSEGRARLQFPGAPPTVVRGAAVHHGIWFTGEWMQTADWRDGLTFRPGRTGSLLIVGDTGGEGIGIEGPSGWNIGLLLRRLGATAVVYPQTPLHLTGLPPGAYRLHSATTTKSAIVRAEGTTTVNLAE
jgi:hypothetical protein